MARYVGALDQGTTSTRFMVFDQGGNEIARHQLEHQQILPQPGWVEHDPLEIAARSDEVIARAMRNANIDARAISPRSASPTSARRRSSGTRRPASPGTTPSSGRTRAPIGSSTRCRTAHGADDPRAHRAAARDLFLRREDPVDPRQRPRRARGGRARRSGVRQSRHLGHLAPHRRARRRRPRHRRHQREPDDADGSGDAASGTTSCWRSSTIPRAMLPAIHASSDRSAFGVTLARRPGRRRGADLRRPRRSAGRDRRPGLHPPGRSEEHLRHRQLHAAQHRAADRPVEGGPADDGVLPDGRRDDLRARGIDRGDRVRGAVAARSAGHHPVGVGDRGARNSVPDNGGIYFVPGVLGPVRAVLALGRARRDRRPVAVQHARRTSPARRSRRSASRRAPSSTRWCRTRASAWRC